MRSSTVRFKLLCQKTSERVTLFKINLLQGGSKRGEPVYQNGAIFVFKGARYLLIIHEVLVAMDFFFCRGAR